jgi:hypothetical protein
MLTVWVICLKKLWVTVSRLRRCKAADVVRNRIIPLLQYHSNNDISVQTACFQPFTNFTSLVKHDLVTPADTAWETGEYFADERHSQPNLSGSVTDVTFS